MQGAGLRQGRRISEGMAGQTTWEAFSRDGPGDACNLVLQVSRAIEKETA